jgi:chromosome segregation ATPase
MEDTKRSEQDSEFQRLLALYGQAMVRVGQLEQEAAALRERLTNVDARSSQVNDDLSKQLASKEHLLKEKDQVIAALRIDLSAARTEFAHLEERLKQAATGAYMLHRRRRRWWQVWRRWPFRRSSRRH